MKLLCITMSFTLLFAGCSLPTGPHQSSRSVGYEVVVLGTARTVYVTFTDNQGKYIVSVVKMNPWKWEATIKVGTQVQLAAHAFGDSTISVSGSIRVDGVLWANQSASGANPQILISGQL